MDQAVVDRYLRLGLEIGRHEDGIVDAYFGPPELAAAVEAAEPVAPSRLVADAEALLDELDDGWLRDQVVGLRTFAGVLAGESMAYADEVEGCYGVRPAHTDESVFTAAHEQLEELLPGDGSVAERYQRWEDSMLVPADRVEPTIAAMFEFARAWTREVFGLPEGEEIELEIVHDEPWMAFCGYLGDFRSRIRVNVDLPLSAIELFVIASHETYPGHHTELCWKDHLLVRERGLLEQTIVLVPTPQSLVAEGIATTAPDLLLESDRSAQLAALCHDAGVELDLAQVLAIRRALDSSRWVSVNAALMLHEGEADESDVRSYIERWGLEKPEISAHVIRFLNEPTSRSYVINYPAGRTLCDAYVGGQPETFRRLLTEQIRVHDLLEAADAREP